MPVLKIFYRDTLDTEVCKHGVHIQEALESMMRNTLRADPARCQVIMLSAGHVTPKPVFVEMQFRANNHRTPEIVSDAMQRVAEILQRALGVGIRIRAFDIDQASLHALDVEGPAQ